MKTRSDALSLLLGIVFLSFIILQSCTRNEIRVDDYQSSVLNNWNQKIMETAVAEDGLLTLKGLRTVSILHIAVHDALNTIVPVYTRYSYAGDPVQVDPVAAAAYAAHAVAVRQYPDQQPQWEAELERWLNGSEDHSGAESAKSLGEAAAASILAEREGDAWNTEADYTWHPMAPGVYAEFNEHSGTPEGFVFGAGWAKAKPFLLPSQDHFRSPPPPEITSEAYTEAFDEVKEVGSTESATRTTDQAHLAMWWKDFVENSHNRLARRLVAKEGLNLWESARAFALMNTAIYDAYVNVFDNKFHYNHWRPYTAIRWAANDENPDTEADSAWNNLHQHTYAFPSYPSAHGTASSAAMTVLTHTLGTGDRYEFTMVTDSVDRAGPFSGKVAMDPPTRTFQRFSEAGLEASMSRVYLGIHFRYDSEVGHQLGTQVGTYACQHYFQPVNGTE